AQTDTEIGEKRQETLHAIAGGLSSGLSDRHRTTEVLDGNLAKQHFLDRRENHPDHFTGAVQRLGNRLARTVLDGPQQPVGMLNRRNAGPDKAMGHAAFLSLAGSYLSL